MPIGDPYVTLTELKSYLDLPDTVDDTEVTSAMESVSTEIEDICHRQFNRAETASTRTYDVATYLVDVDDFYTTTGLVIAVDGVTWPASDYVLRPRNGVVNGRPGWPFWTVELASRRWPACSSGSVLSVTACWGWASVPPPIKEACKIVASDTFGLRGTKFGVAGWGAYGDIRVRDNPMAMRKLAPYVLDDLLVG
jgi:hypothetical protein